MFYWVFVFNIFTLFNCFSFFKHRTFVLLFNLPLAIISLLCAPSFFILYIIYLFENFVYGSTLIVTDVEIYLYDAV